jgi:hypothetical protein
MASDLNIGWGGVLCQGVLGSRTGIVGIDVGVGNTLPTAMYLTAVCCTIFPVEDAVCS